MKWFKPRFIIVLLLGLLVTELAWAHDHFHHHRAHVGVSIGVPLFAPWYYPPPQVYAYTYPPVATIQSPPQAYIEMNARQQQQSGQWWYYCESAQAYYPYVKECPQGWQQVEPQPSDLR